MFYTKNETCKKQRLVKKIKIKDKKATVNIIKVYYFF